MKIHEYQGKDLFKSYGIPVFDYTIVTTPEEALEAYNTYGGETVFKAQVLVGGRGKAGGVKLVDNAEEAEATAKSILGLNIKGLPVEKLMITPSSQIHREYYMGMILDRTSKSITVMMSKAGGVDIEDLAVNRPDEIIKFSIFPHLGVDEAVLDSNLEKVFAEPELRVQARDALLKLYKLFLEKDCSLVEINPYVLGDNNKLIALDSKVNFDDNALYKHEDIAALKNPEEESADEVEAKKWGLSFVSMDGDIGCIVNGAGLAMATMDLIKLAGGEPANFLDVGGSSNPDKVLHALKIITGNKKVKAILINIFGGITRCDDIAKGILLAMDQIDIDLPLVIRLIGTNDAEGRKILTDAGIEVGEHLGEAVEQVVASSRRKGQ